MAFTVAISTFDVGLNNGLQIDLNEVDKMIP